MKRVVTIQDISCIGKCSLTVALPIISAMGLETAVLPTAVLSAHTAFEGFTFQDLTNQIRPVARHWQQQGIEFDAVYTGYLGSFRQLQLVEEFIDTFHREGQTVVVDPVMGDHGKLYPGFSPDFAREMAKLCSRADVIVPNLTEVAFLLEEPYRQDYTLEELQPLLKRLHGLGAKKVLITGVGLPEGKLGVMGYDGEADRFFTYLRQRCPQSFHGTGDVFASTLTGALTRGADLEQAARLAVDFTVASIEKTLQDPDHRWYGVNFESAIPMLVQRCEEL